METTTILLVGVGGQGTILAADLLARTALACGFDVKVSEIHGMAQRGGSVETVVRFGDEVHSMVCDAGDADFVVAFEKIEALRALDRLSEAGTLIVADEVIAPMSVLTGAAPMPASIDERLAEAGAVIIDVDSLALQAGNAKTVNVALLGALSALVPFESEPWERVIADHVPQKTIEANIAAFRLGHDALAALAL